MLVHRRSRARLAVLVLLSTIAAADCRHAPPQLTPPGAAAFHGDRVIKGVATLQDITTTGEAEGVVSRDNARTIITATQIAGTAGADLAKALRAGLSAEGAKAKAIATIQQAFADVPGQLTPETRRLIEPYLTIINSALAYLK